MEKLENSTFSWKWLQMEPILSKKIKKARRMKGISHQMRLPQ